MEEYYLETLSLLQKGNIKIAKSRIEKVLIGKKITPTNQLNYKILFVSLYIEIVELLKYSINHLDEANLLISKTFQMYKKYEGEFKEKDFLNLNRARLYGNRYDIKNIKYQFEAKKSDIIDYTNLKSIYEIDDCLSDGIYLYREYLHSNPKDNENWQEIYQVRNNLALFLSRTGRYLEALDFFKSNIDLDSKKMESIASFADILQTFAKISKLPVTESLYIVLGNAYYSAIKLCFNEINKSQLIKKLNAIKSKLIIHYQSKFTKSLYLKCRSEEIKEFKSLSEFRQFVIDNSLSLNEHSIYCKCKDAEKDNLQIGTLIGSTHTHVYEKFEELDGYINRIKSEYSYSRLLYFNFIFNLLEYPNDTEFTDISNENDALGYRIEQIRSCYRLVYSVLDKIMNGVMLLYGIERRKKDYFESFFFNHRENFSNKTNLHLAALYSISKDLNTENGIFKYFKLYRNEMEHGYFPLKLNSENTISEAEFKNLTFELLKLTRAAIFSFVFLIRSETITN